jgi:hypothetical protein
MRKVQQVTGIMARQPLRKTGSKTKILKKPQKAQRMMPPPPGVAELLEMVNELPPEAIDIERLYKHVRKTNPQLEDKYHEFNEKFLKEFENLLSQFPQGVRDFVGSIRDTNSSYINPDAAKKYSLLISARDFLALVASTNANAVRELQVYAQKPLNEKNITEYWAAPNRLFILSSVPIPLVDLSVNGKGELEWKFNVMLEVLKKARIIRIRRCRVCNLYYWAGRIDQLCCSSRCSNTYRQRLWRQGYDEKYQFQRINRANEIEKQQAISSNSKSSKQKGGR